MAETLISPGVLARENDLSFLQPAPLAAGAAFVGPAVKGPVNIPTVVTSYSDYTNKFGATFTSGSTKLEFLTSIAVKNYFDQGGQSALVVRVGSGSFAPATTTHISASADSDTSPFVLKTLGKGDIFNNSTGLTDPGEHNSDSSLVSGSVDNLRWEISSVNESRGTFNLSIRRGDDSKNNKIVLESWPNLSLDPESDNYIEKVIGNQVENVNVSEDQYFLEKSGSFQNKSRYVYVGAVNRPTLNYLALDGKTINSGDVVTGGSFSGSLPVASSGSFYGATGTVYGNGEGFFTQIGDKTQGLQAGNYSVAFNLLSNQDEYQFNVIAAPGLVYGVANHVAVLNDLISRVESRGDAILVLDLETYGSTIASVVSEAGNVNSSYAASYWPWVKVLSSTGKQVFVPASTVIPGVYAFTDRSSAPWFAPAGLVRGGVPGVIEAERKLTKTNRDTLYDGKVNPIATFPGVAGVAVFGQKTLQTKASALDRVNVRRLLIELKKFFSDQARNLVFEQNTIATRNRFLSIVNPYLSSVAQRQGLYAFRVVMDDTNNTNDVIDRNQLVGQVFIQPAKTAEFILLDFVVEPTGASFAA